MISVLKKITLMMLLVSIPSVLYAQFGKNKVQYNEHDWVYLKTKHFDVYFYKGGEYIAEFAAEVLEDYLDKYQREFDYNIRKRKMLLFPTWKRE